MGTSVTILLILALLCWLLLLASSAGFVGQDASGDRAVGTAFAAISAMVVGGVLWLLLAGLLLVSGSRDLLPRWVQIAALVLHPASAAAGFAAVYLCTTSPRPRWPAVVLLLPPLLTLAYLLLVHVPALRANIPLETISAIAWGIVLLLVLSPWPAIAFRNAIPRPARSIPYVDESQTRRDEALQSLAAVPPGSPVRRYFQYLDLDSPVRSEALQAVRSLSNRQEQVENLLEAGLWFPMGFLGEVDLNATARLCQAAKTLVRSRANEVRLPDPPPAYTLYAQDRSLLLGVRWLDSAGCSCRDEIAALRDMVNRYADSADRRAMLQQLDQPAGNK